MTGHYVQKCEKCGAVISQCRCPACDKTVIVKGVCSKCSKLGYELGPGDFLFVGEKKEEHPVDTPTPRYRASCPGCDTFMSWNPSIKMWQCPRCGHQE